MQEAANEREIGARQGAIRKRGAQAQVYLQFNSLQHVKTKNVTNQPTVQLNATIINIAAYLAASLDVLVCSHIILLSAGGREQESDWCSTG